MEIQTFKTKAKYGKLQLKRSLKKEGQERRECAINYMNPAMMKSKSHVQKRWVFNCFKIRTLSEVIFGIYFSSKWVQVKESQGIRRMQGFMHQ